MRHKIKISQSEKERGERETDRRVTTRQRESKGLIIIIMK